MISFFRKHSERLGIVMGAITLVGLGFLTQRLLDVERACLTFPSVIELRLEGQKDPVRSCASQSRLSSPQVSIEHRQTLDAINQLNRMADLLPKHLRGVSVTITESDPFFFIQSERSLVIGSELARTQAFLQRAIINVLSAQAFSGQGGHKKEVVADLLWAFFKSEDLTIDPTTLELVQTSDWIQIPQTPKSIADYCAHPLRRIEDLSFCRFEFSKDQYVTNWMRFRPLISWSLIKVLRQEGLYTTSNAIRTLFTTSASPKLEQDPNTPEIEDNVWVKDQIFQWLEIMKVSNNSEEKEKTLSALWSGHNIDTHGEFDFVVNVDSPQLADRALSSLLEWQKESFIGKVSRVLVLTPEGQVELPLAKKTHYDLTKISSKTHLVLGCELPEMRDIASLNTTNLLAIKVCSATELPHWAEILKEGQSNKSALMRFKIHMPSAERWARHNPDVYLSRARLDSIFCDEKTFSGYPFESFGCAKTAVHPAKNTVKTGI